MLLQGKKGLILRKFLKELHHKLLFEENKEGIDEKLTEIDSILSVIDDEDAVKKYRLWVDYVKIVFYNSRKAELDSNYQTGIDAEKQIQRLCDENAENLKNYVSIRSVKNISEIAEQRFKEWIEGKKADNYTM